MKYLCALEAVNLDNLFSDCQDLSTVRGGGLSVLNIAESVVKGLNIPPEDFISGGASQGFLRLAAASAEEAETRVRNALMQSEILRHTTIMVAAVQDEGDDAFARQRALLKTRMRWAQLQSPSVVYPALSGQMVCDIDKVRPARQNGVISEFTSLRRELGRTEKKRLLREILGSPADKVEIVGDLDELSKGQTGNLTGKIAAFRFDGNDFGKLGHACRTPGAFRAFSESVQSGQKDFFRGLLLDSRGQLRQEWLHDQRLQLEIVVYGGDEVSFLTPARLGWKTLQSFYEAAKDWAVEGTPLTYAGGAVFCHHKAPIHAIKRLAGELADHAKTWSKNQHGSKGNYVCYQVLESFDNLGRDLDEFMEERYRHVGAGAALSLDEIGGIEEDIGLWRSHLSKRKLHVLARSILDGGEVDFEAAMKEMLEAKSSDAKKIRGQIEKLHQRIGDAVFVHLLELWDYAGVGK